MSNIQRLEKLRKALEKQELDGIFISQPENRFYLSGFDGSAGYLLITQKDALLATDFRYLEQVKQQAPDFTLFHITGPVTEWFPLLTDISNLKKLGFESGHMTQGFYRTLTETIGKTGSGLQLMPTDGIVETIRAIKEPVEFDLMMKAIEVTNRAFAFIEETIHEGMTETDVSWELEKYHRENGCQGLAFETIVASGPNAALPHHKPADRVIQKGEPITIDMGGRFNGYCSDFTRTICIGEPDDTFRKVYDTVLGAQLTAIALIKSGITGKEADGYARTVIEEAGYGKEFGHSLGHGIGIVAHEKPGVGPSSNDILEDGMIFSVEPGIYIPGWGGVRIEDLAALENGVIRVLSQGTK